MNNVAKVGGDLPANISNLAVGLAQSISTAGTAAGNELYARFTKQGEWIYGSDETEVEEGSIWAVNPTQFRHGWIAWDQNDMSSGPKGEVLVPATQPLPPEESLPSVSGKWSKAVAVMLRCISGEDEGVQVLYKTNSNGGRKAYAALLQQVVARLQEGNTDIVALVTLDAESYKHKQYGKIFNPIFNVTGWANMDGEPAEETKAIEAEEPEDEVQETPRRRRRA